MQTISSTSDLIMQEQFALGQITPFLGSRPWMSLKLWFAMKNLGKKGFGEVIDARYQIAVDLSKMIDGSPDFTMLNKVDINAAAFMYTGKNNNTNLEDLNTLNKRIYAQIIAEGKYHLHQFSVPDSTGVFKKDAIIHPLRFMSGNPLITKKHLRGMLDYVSDIGSRIEGGHEV